MINVNFLLIYFLISLVLIQYDCIEMSIFIKDFNSNSYFDGILLRNDELLRSNLNLNEMSGFSKFERAVISWSKTVGKRRDIQYQIKVANSRKVRINNYSTIISIPPRGTLSSVTSNFTLFTNCLRNISTHETDDDDDDGDYGGDIGVGNGESEKENDRLQIKLRFSFYWKPFKQTPNHKLTITYHLSCDKDRTNSSKFKPHQPIQSSQLPSLAPSSASLGNYKTTAICLFIFFGLFFLTLIVGPIIYMYHKRQKQLIWKIRAHHTTEPSKFLPSSLLREEILAKPLRGKPIFSTPSTSFKLPKKSLSEKSQTNLNYHEEQGENSHNPYIDQLTKPSNEFDIESIKTLTNRIRYKKFKRRRRKCRKNEMREQIGNCDGCSETNQSLIWKQKTKDVWENNSDEDKMSFFTASSKDTHQTGATPIVKRRFKDPLRIINELQIPRTDITLRNIIVEGTFCQLYEGLLVVKNTKSQKYQNVLIKTLTESSTENQIKVLLKDGCLLAGLRHKNLCPLVRAATTIYSSLSQPLQPPWLIYPLGKCSGNLKLILQQRTKLIIGGREQEICIGNNSRYHNLLGVHVASPKRTYIPTPRIIHLAIQLLKALKYLHDRSIIHRDIATRNCFLEGEDHLKLSDSALSRDLFPEDYHCLGDNENRPVKWLSVEALVMRRFSVSSDLWAFGVFCWELVVKARVPYEEIDPFEMPSVLRSGYRLQQPDNCPDKLWSIISDCWKADCEDRPKLPQLLWKLKQFQKILSDFV